jgi:hypothetical protein
VLIGSLLEQLDLVLQALQQLCKPKHLSLTYSQALQGHLLETRNQWPHKTVGNLGNTVFKGNVLQRDKTDWLHNTDDR